MPPPVCIGEEGSVHAVLPSVILSARQYVFLCFSLLAERGTNFPQTEPLWSNPSHKRHEVKLPDNLPPG